MMNVDFNNTMANVLAWNVKAAREASNMRDKMRFEAQADSIRNKMGFR